MFSSSPDRTTRQRDNAAPSALGTLPLSHGRRVAHTGSSFPCPILFQASGVRRQASGISRRLAIAALLVSVLPSSVLAADTYTPPVAFDTWLACAFYVVALVTAVVILFQKLWPTRKPTIESEFISKTDLDRWCVLRHSPIMEHLNRIEASMASFHAATLAANKNHEERSARVHERVDRLTRVTYQIAGKLDIHESE
jgi:hypothetical protein